MHDIAAALADTPAGDHGHRCKIGRWLDGIPADAPGRAELVAAFESTDRTLPQLEKIAARLDHPMSDKTIQQHRAGVCRCTW